MTAEARNVLYISYDGLTDPLGRSQILPYLAGLSARGHRITILSAEKRDHLATEGAEVKRLCAASGIDWQPLAYHRHPPVASTVYDLVQLRRAAERLHRTRNFDLIHCRSYIPAIVGLWLKRRFGIPFLFDMRGFWAEEKVEGGAWRLSNPLFRAVYRYFKAREADCLREADQIVSLTEAAKAEMESRPELAGRDNAIGVIPCCVDLDHFQAAGTAREQGRAALGIAAQVPVLAYLGSLGGNYLLDEMLLFFRAFRERRPGALFLFVTRDDPQLIRTAAAAMGLPPETILIRPATRDEVPTLLAAADLGVAFKQANFSALACSPTKIGEMLAAGLPVVANRGVGDVAAVLADGTAGVLVERFDEASLQAAVDAAIRLRPGDGAIRAHAEHWFSLADGIERYDIMYRRTGAPKPAQA